jgi:hypothetical protein
MLDPGAQWKKMAVDKAATGKRKAAGEREASPISAFQSFSFESPPPYRQAQGPEQVEGLLYPRYGSL